MSLYGPNVYSGIVKVDHMWPGVAIGDTLLIDPDAKLREHDIVVLYRNDEEINLLAIFLRETSKRWILKVWNPVGEFELEKKHWPKAHPVIEVEMTRGGRTPIGWGD